MAKELLVSPGPHIAKGYTTRQIMLDVIIALLPAVAAACWFFRSRAAALIATCVVTCVLTEWLCNKARRRPSSIGDLSAVITGLILALSLPASLPWWAAVIGSAFAIAIGKMVFGGLGANIFNPAMIGRTFLTACFGMLMTTWTVPAGITVPAQSSIVPGSTIVSDSNPDVDGITRATPLAISKNAIKTRNSEDKTKIIEAKAVNNLLPRLVIGTRPGCLGETSTIAILIGAAYLLLRRTINWEIPLALLAAAFAFGLGAYVVNPAAYIAPWTHLLSGGMLFAAVFIATDPVTAPVNRAGLWIFGAGIGIMTMLIRVVGEYPEGVMYAVLLMNAFTPMIDRFCKPVPLGGIPNAA